MVAIIIWASLRYTQVMSANDLSDCYPRINGIGTIGMGTYLSSRSYADIRKGYVSLGICKLSSQLVINY